MWSKLLETWKLICYIIDRNFNEWKFLRKEVLLKTKSQSLKPRLLYLMLLFLSLQYLEGVVWSFLFFFLQLFYIAALHITNVQKKFYMWGYKKWGLIGDLLYTWRAKIKHAKFENPTISQFFKYFSVQLGLLLLTQCHLV